MKLLDLFSGIGGFSLGLERAGFETIAFCEIEDYPRKVLAKHWPGIPIAGDIRKLSYKNGGLIYDGQTIYRGAIDAICGGFPCQDISVAGNQKGIEAERSGLWSELHRLISEIRPKYAIMENVSALLSGDSGRWFQRVLGDLAEIRFDAEWHCIPACYIGASHRRDRVWIIAYSNVPNGERDFKKPIFRQSDLQREFSGVFEKWRERSDLPRAILFRTVDGVSNFSHRIKGLGNAVVPQVVELLGKAIIKDNHEN